MNPPNAVSTAIRKQFPYQPTGDQETLIDRLSDFIRNPEIATMFLLKGYAGTGKTTIVSSLVQVLPSLKARGRAAGPHRKGCQGFLCLFGPSGIHHP
jgi:Mg-chelatase subunit ChlI